MFTRGELDEVIIKQAQKADTLDECCLVIQNWLGVDSGDVAGMFWNEHASDAHKTHPGLVRLYFQTEVDYITSGAEDPDTDPEPVKDGAAPEENEKEELKPYMVGTQFNYLQRLGFKRNEECPQILEYKFVLNGLPKTWAKINIDTINPANSDTGNNLIGVGVEYTESPGTAIFYTAGFSINLHVVEDVKRLIERFHESAAGLIQDEFKLRTMIARAAISATVTPERITIWNVDRR